jgi:hypothetical protein
MAVASDQFLSRLKTPSLEVRNMRQLVAYLIVGTQFRDLISEDDVRQIRQIENEEW